jgi:hypothetical protein
MFKFLVLWYQETQIVHEQSIDGGILDQKLGDADALISALWRRIP